jgi:hypothetical protein
MNCDEIEMIKGYRAAVVKTFAEVFAAEVGQFPEGQRLLRRVNRLRHGGLPAIGDERGA